ncbi:Senescence-associated carboxylesterase 101 [Vitis vinifera]|uniref:Senescence-associated carboxylesterase 101 n=1 Tax=Vitis vinifera TaxID=29760 RepID=A0A438DX64_VITVI|nr:Senescence-associated carboxylesterase 101 [Vitis vinifera]
MGYYDCFKNQGSKRDIKVEEFRGNLTMYWEDMVAQVQRKPQKEGATFRTRWLYAGTVYRRMVEPLDIAAFYGEGKTDYINNRRSLHYKLLQQWYEEDVKPLSRDKLDSKKQKVSGILTEDSLFWAHVEEAILSCELLKSENCTLEQGKSSWDNLVKFEEYVMEQINNYAASPEIFLPESSFMKWWGLYEGYIDTCSNSHGSPLINFMKKRSYMKYALETWGVKETLKWNRWEDMVEQVERKPHQEGAALQTLCLCTGTNYRKMVEPLDIAAYHREGGRHYITNGGSKHYTLLEQ